MAASARAGLRLALATFQRLFAPFLPFVAEEVWSWWQPGSVHRQPWPNAGSLRDGAGAVDPALLAVTTDVLAAIRKAKTEAKVSMRSPVAQLVVRDNDERLALLSLALDDVRLAGSVEELGTERADQASISVALGPG